MKLMKFKVTAGATSYASLGLSLVLVWQFCPLPARANPTGGTVAQGAATFSTAGSQFTINQTSANTLINWQSFNIGSGQTTTFNQPSASSVAWNQINGTSPSQIDGNLNANGYVILQNQNGFSIGGSAVINAHDLVLTTSPTAAPTLSSGGPWTFSSLPPSAKIINYGQINIAGGGSAFLIASDIENNGAISAPAGNLGLCAGQQVLLSRSPDGRGVNVKVTLPQGSVDNEGRLIADAGSIVAQAQAVNNNGLMQANSVQNNNGVIELVASDNVHLGANSVISAQGSSTGISPGGSVTVKSDHTFSDQAGSTINAAGGAQGGNGGDVEVSAPQMSSLQSVVHGPAAAGYVGGTLTIDPANIWLAAAATDPGAPAGYTVLDVNAYSGLSAINVLADDNITLNTLWTLASVSSPATLNLTATTGNITFNSGSGIVAPRNAQDNWNLNLSAGSAITLNVGTTLQADAGRINLNAANVSLSGTLQANSIGQANGVIDVHASGNLTLGTTADIEAQGDPTSANASPGGFVTLQAGNAAGNIFSDTSTSKINVAGQNGGQAGIVQIFGHNLDGTLGQTGDANSVQSTIGTPFALLLNPYDLTLSQDSTGTSLDANNNLDANFNLGDLAAYTQIDLHALDNIELSAPWTLYATATPAALSLQAGNSIILDDGSSINAVNFDANNNVVNNTWAVNLTAGTALTSAAGVTSGNDGVYLDGSASIQTQAGGINIAAANEVQVGWQGTETLGVANKGTGSITTTAGGSISVLATYGDVNSGSKPGGYLFNQGPPPYHYTVSTALGGISTAVGGNVSITAGGNVTSYLPTSATVKTDAGTGAFGPEAGNVTIMAGGSVYGHYVEADGTGSITAENGDAGAITVHTGSDNNTTANSSFALSLVKGSWDVEAPKGSIYLQEVRDPNGVFNNSGGGAHFFDYDPFAAVSLNAGNGVAITGGSQMPRITGQVVPLVLPPTLEITAGAGGVTLYQGVTLFQSPDGNLNITTSGNLTGVPADGINPQLYMSDSSSSQWSFRSNPLIFGRGLNASPPVELNNPNPVVLNVSGSLNTLDIYATKATDITVGKDMINSSFVGENLHAADVSSITVGGKLYYSPFYAFEKLSQPIVTVPYGTEDPVFDPDWSTIFYLLVNPTVAASVVIPSTATTAQLKDYVDNLQNWATVPGNIWQFPSASGSPSASNPGFVYNPTTQTLGFGGPMSADVYSKLTGPLEVVQLNANGLPVVQNGHLVLTPVTFVDSSSLTALYQASQGSAGEPAAGLQIGGPGLFKINAGSMDLGNSQGIESWGIVGPLISSSAVGNNYVSLGSLTTAGAAVDVTVSGDLAMLTSRIASMYGGNITVDVGGSMDLGTQGIASQAYDNAYGIYTTGHSDVSVTAVGDIAINGSRIAAFNGGNVTVESTAGSVDVGSGADTYVTVPLVSASALPAFTKVGDGNGDFSYYVGYQIYGSGVVATSLPKSIQAAGENPLPGNITVETPNGNISSSDAGVLQYALDGSTAAGPTITLVAGTPNVASTANQGNVDLGHSGVIGGSVDISAQGNVSGLVISRQNSVINTVGSFSGTLLAAGTADISAGGSVSGTIIGVGGITANAGSMTATLLSQNVSGGTSALASSATTTTTGASAAATASAEATQQANTAPTDNQNQDDLKKKKLPLIRKLSRVTVILSSIPH